MCLMSLRSGGHRKVLWVPAPMINHWPTRLRNFSPWNLIKSDLLKARKNGDFRFAGLCVVMARARNVSFVAIAIWPHPNDERTSWQRGITNREERLLNLAMMRAFSWMISWCPGSIGHIMSNKIQQWWCESRVRRAAMKQRARRTSSQNGFIQIQFIKVFLINLSMTSQIYDCEHTKKWI